MPAKRSIAASVRKMNNLCSRCAAHWHLFVIGITLLGLLTGLMLSAKPQTATCDIHGDLGELSRLAVLTLAHRAEAHSVGQLHDPMAMQLSSAVCPEWAARPNHQAGSRGIGVAAIERARASDQHLEPLLMAAAQYNTVTVLNIGAGMCTRYWRLQLTRIEQVCYRCTYSLECPEGTSARSDGSILIWHH